MLPQLHAEQQLDAIEAATAPHMGGDAHGRLIARLQRTLAVQVKPIRPTPEQLAAIGVQVVSVTREQWEKGEEVNRDG